MTNAGSAARETARRLLARETAGIDDPAAAMERACMRVSASLRRSVGDDGYNALLTRALAAAEGDHPVLMDIRRFDGAQIHLDGVLATVNAHGVRVVAAALESLLAAIADLLGSLIGEDMVLSLLDDRGQSPQTRTGKETA